MRWHCTADAAVLTEAFGTLPHQMGNLSNRGAIGLMNRAIAQSTIILCIFAAMFCLNAFADEMQPIVLGDDPQPPDVDLTFQGHTGDVTSPITVFILNPYQRPWQVNIAGGELVHQENPAHIVEAGQIKYRDVRAPTDWTGYYGDIANAAAQPHMKIEMLIELAGTEAPGYYVGDAVLSWMVWPVEGMPALVGTLTLRLHLNIPEMLEASLEPKLMTFPEHSGGDEGWIYSENQPTLTVTSNTDFQIAISSAPALTSENTPDYKMPMALRMWMPAGDATPTWETWGDLGGKPHGQISGPWDPALCNAASPWPGAVQQFTTAGVNEIGLEGAAWRSGLGDVVGKYNTTIVFTLSVP